eukprot:CAMPEP_0198145946 /NCGR_PEP_ID=MMETSP1443-20131203/26375_1 /TAXON_ID=186043 /ORGANISM="Entomoneis sp., Strain CCMP2396" /LENGTH=260 /DNA_ID=CAMNT_0043809721 /DNA_START=66 /DNA_END=848 /DNA_ORIENTATION=+
MLSLQSPYIILLVLFNATGALGFSPVPTVVEGTLRDVRIQHCYCSGTTTTKTTTKNEPRTILVGQSRLFMSGTEPLDDIGVTKNSENNNNDTSKKQNEGRSNGLRKALLAVGEVAKGGGDSRIIRVGSTVVAKSNIPDLSIWQSQTYELTSIYDQGVNEDTGVVEKVPRESLLQDPDGTVQQQTPSSYTRYMTLFSNKYHDVPVIVSPQEVQLSSMRTEVVDSLVMGLPLFGFWTAVAFSFANKYTERTGGSLLDAFFGR